MTKTEPNPLDGMLIDGETGAIAWDAINEARSPKAAFALKAASMMLAGRLTLDQVEEQIIAAANARLNAESRPGNLITMKDVQLSASGTAYTWFQELKRVAAVPPALRRLVDQEGHGLTRLYRDIGPAQRQNAKGRVQVSPSQSVSGSRATSAFGVDEAVRLDPESEAIVDRIVGSGRFPSRSDVLREGVRLVRDREARLARFDAEMMKGIASAEAGHLIPVDKVFDELDSYLDELLRKNAA